MSKQGDGVYVNKGSQALQGTTWGYVPRSPFGSEEITWENKRAVLEREARKYKEEHPEADALTCYLRGKHYVNRQQKHFKAYLKGKNSYQYKQGTYLVEDMSRVEKFMKLAQEMEEKAAAKAESEKEKEVKIEEEIVINE